MQCKCGAEIGPWRENKDGTRIAKCSGCTRVVKRWVTVAGSQCSLHCPDPQSLQEEQNIGISPERQ